ncbi:hypothetical protein ACR52_27585 [Pseudomonas fildesensis]|uniref:Uncharacterized protein n=1 Tax=Pseudomonas fildesensis TaxID=1674920 RepID=A0A0J8FPP1_9PSED|nr:hypothetical protein ACR52_27585 [Pseudomonas fildesensis]
MSAFSPEGYALKGRSLAAMTRMKRLKTRVINCRRRLVGDGVRKIIAGLSGLIAGKPAPTSLMVIAG